MPFFTPPEDDFALRSAGPGLPPERPVNPDTLMDAALRQNNTVVAAVQAYRNSGNFAPEDGHNSLDAIKGTVYEQRYLNRFVASRSAAEDRHIMSAIDGELEDQRIIQQSGKAGVVAGFVAGAFDPTLALPSGVAVQAGKEGLVFTKAAAHVGIAGAGQAAVQEAILQATQQTRSLKDSVLNVGTATVLSAILGGSAARLFTPRENLAMVGELNRLRVDMDAHARGEPPPVGFEVYHGSPHDFEAFDISKIGTGDGAQSYGHGLYFAEHPEVARTYSEMGEQWSVNGRPYNVENPIHRASALMDEFHGKRQAAVKEAQRMFDHDATDYNRSLLDYLKSDKDIPTIEKTAAGNVYKVRILADKERFLDWDKPLSEQTPEIQAKLQQMMGPEKWEEFKHADTATAVKQGFIAFSDEQVSAKLREAGIPGIKYLDQGSRAPVELPGRIARLEENISQRLAKGETEAEVADLRERVQGFRDELATAKEGTRNYVVFDDKLLQATHRNGEPLIQQIPAAAAQAQSVGAAASDTRKLELVGTGIRIERAPFDPLTRLVTSNSTSARRAAVDLAESPLEFAQNIEGVPTTNGPALDRIMRLTVNQTRVAVSDQLLELWQGLRFGGEQAPVAARFRDRMGLLDRPRDLPTYEEFKAQVSEAMINGDRHETPQVQAAAEFIRKNVFDPWKERAIAAKLLPEDIDVKTADSYVQRVYNKQAIAAKRPEFVNTVLSWLQSDQETKAAAKSRIEGLNRQLQASKDRLAKLEGREGKEREFALMQAQHDAIRTDIEREIGAWEGKSSAEAKAHLKAREKSEAARTELSRQGKPRLESADKAVDRAVRDIIESDRDLSVGELRSRAHEITERILGSPDGRLPYDEHMGGPEVGYHPTAPVPPRGPLARREFNIPDAQIREFLEQDIERITAIHLRTMVPDVMLTERFGDVRMTESFRKIEDDFASLTDQTKSERERTKLGKEREQALKDLAGIRDRVRGVYGLDTFNAMRGAARVALAMKNYNVLASMGMATISSLPDMAGAVFRWGLGTVFRDAWAPFTRSLVTGDRELVGEALRQFRAMGIATETFTATRHHALTDMFENYRPQSPVERTLQVGADKFQLLNLLGPWTDMGKVIASTVASQEIFRAAEAWTKGTATQRQIRNLAANNIDAAMAGKIAEQYRSTGNIVEGVHLPNTGDWTDQAARQAFEGAVAREADIAIVTPGQEKPLWLSNPVVNILGQFKSFTAAATQRILIANLQRRDAQALQGVLFSMGLGMVSYKVNSLLGGQPVSDRPQDWVKESISRGNLFGWLEEGNALASKMSRGGVDAYRMLGADKPLSRYAGRSVIDQLLGPTAGKFEALSKITGATGSALLGKGDWNHSDTSALRKLTAMQNLFYLRSLLNQVEAGANSTFGIDPKPEPKPH